MKWFLNIGNLVKVVISLITLGGIILGGIKGYNKAIINRENKKVVQETIVTELKSLNVKVDSLVSGQEQMKELVNEHTSKLNQVDRKQDVMKGIMTREFAKTMTPAQVLEMMEQFEIKKNESYFNEIQLERSPLWIPYSFRSELEK